MLRLAGAAHIVRGIEQGGRSAHVACCASMITCQTRGYAEAAPDALPGDGLVLNPSACGTELILFEASVLRARLLVQVQGKPGSRWMCCKQRYGWTVASELQPRCARSAQSQLAMLRVALWHHLNPLQKVCAAQNPRARLPSTTPAPSLVIILCPCCRQAAFPPACMDWQAMASGCCL